jgi:hypothetical protein
MPRTRPTSVLVIAILQLVFGGLGMASSLCGLAVPMVMKALVPPPPPGPGGVQPITQETMAEFFEQHVPGYQASQYLGTVMAFGLCGLMLASGMGLLRMRPWGRTLAIVFAILAILYLVFYFTYSLLYLTPAMTEFFRQALAQGQMGPGIQQQQQQAFLNFMEVMMRIGNFLSLAFLIYPAVVLFILLRRNVAAAFLDESAAIPVAEAAEGFDPLEDPER